MKKNIFKKILIVAALVFFGFGITNVCAMEEQDDAVQDPTAAAGYADVPQVPAPAAAPIAPGTPQDPETAAGGAVVGTPVREKAQDAYAQLQSAKKATINITNYCRGIIEALNEDRIGDVLVLLDSFYKKIPSTLKNSTRKKTKGQKNDAFEAKLREDALNYHKSLFLCLAMCLKMSVSVEHPASSGLLTEKIVCDGDLSEISFKLITVRSKAYLIKFKISEKHDDKSSVSRLSESSDQNSEWLIDVGTEISLLEPAAVGAGAINISGGYKTENFFKNTTTALVPSSSELRAPVIEAPDFGDAMSSDAAAAGPAAPKVDEVLQNNLTLIFNAIPHAHRVYLEQYYHFLIFSLVNFMGSCLCFAEFITGDGRADLIIRTERDGVLHGSIIELKRGKTPNEALFQITDREYINSFDEEFQIVGISISGRDEESVTVACGKQKIAPKPATISGGDGAYSMQITSNIPKPKVKSKKPAVVAAAGSQPVVGTFADASTTPAVAAARPTAPVAESVKKRKLAKKGKGGPIVKRSKSSDDSGSEEAASDD